MPNANGIYSGDEIASLWVSEGGAAALAPTMAAIALTESGGDPNAVCYDYPDPANPKNTLCSKTDRPDAFQVDTGLWQVANVNLGATATKADGVAILSDPATNAQHAVSVLASQGLGAWSTYGTSAFQANLAKVSGTVSGAVQSVASGYGSNPAPATKTTPTAAQTTNTGTPGFFGPVIDAAKGIALEAFVGAAALALLAGGITWLAATDSNVRSTVTKAALA